MSTISASTTTTTAYKVTADTTGTLVLQTGSTPTTAVTIDSSQIVGVGVVPNAWSGTNAKGLQVGLSLALGYSNSTGSFIGGNAYWGGNWKRVTTGGATAYLLGTDGTHIWYGTSTSSSADSTITFTQPMTLDANGKLLVGNTSSLGSPYIQSQSTNATTVSSSYAWNTSDTGIVLRNISNTTNSAIGISLFGGSGGNSAAGIYMVQETANSLGGLAFYTGGSGRSNSVPEAVRIDSSANFAITQAPGKYTVDVTGGATSIANSGTVDFGTASGMLIANNYSQGGVAIWICGGGGVTSVSTVASGYGSLAYNAGIDGYRWTNNSGATANFGFFFIRTRRNA